MAMYGLYDTYDDYLRYTDFDVYDEPEIEPDKDCVFVDDEGEPEQIEAHYGCKMEDLSEEQLFEIINKLTDVPGRLQSAKWNPGWSSIDYTYYFEE